MDKKRNPLKKIVSRKLQVIPILFITLLGLMLFGCATTRDDVALFYMGENALQYFFPAKMWENSDETLRLEPDFLYRSYALDGEEENRTLINFSFYSEGNLFRKRPEAILLKSAGLVIEIEAARIEQIYIDRGKARYSCWISSSDFYRLMEAAAEAGALDAGSVEAGALEVGTVEIILTLEGRELRFLSPEAFSDHIRYFQEVLL